MKKISMITKMVITLCVLLSCCELFSQNAENKSENFSGKHQLRISVTPALFQSMEVVSMGKMSPTVKSSPLPSGDFSLLYSNFWKRGWGMNIGLGMTASPYNFYFKEYSKDGILIPEMSETNYIPMVILPLSVQKLFPTQNKSNRWFSVELGVKLNYNFDDLKKEEGSLGYKMNDNAADIPLFEYSIYGTQKMIVSGFAKLGFVVQSKNKNTFHYNMVLHYSPTKLTRGTYQFHESGNNVFGAFMQNMNYIGFEFCYGLTWNKKK